jgi:signal transduction histidine kinase
VDSLRRRIDPTDAEGFEIAERVKEDLRRALSDLRSLIDGLRPPALDQLGLVGALQDHVGSLTGAGLDVRLQAGPLPALGPAAEVAAYRIVVEALTNVLKHARATTAEVCLRLMDDRWLEVVVADDGAGPSEDGARAGRGVGLGSMTERATELGGTLDVNGRSGGGTVVVARIPREAE